LKQLSGEYCLKNEGVRPLCQVVKELIAKIGRVEVQYLAREMNREADVLANKAIDGKIRNRRLEI